jgi:hypothetical protein
MHEAVEEWARAVDLPVSIAVTSIFMVQQTPIQPAPQVSSATRPQNEFMTRQEFKRRWQQTWEVAQPDTSSSPATEAPEISPRTTDKGLSALRPANLRV